MSSDQPHRRGVSWPDIDSFDIPPFSPVDSYFGLARDDALSNLENSFNESLQRQASNLTIQQAVKYGQGVEAQRSARYRTYDIKQSDIFQELRDMYGTVTKEMLFGLITASMDSCPLHLRPLPPTRTQKRAKAGLVAWIDDHPRLIASYLRLHRISF
jgi:hypothetical protein